MKNFIPSFLLLGFISVASAADVVFMPDSTNQRLVSFSPVDGSLINSNVFPFAGGGATPVSAIKVGSEIWVSEQSGNKISRYDFSGTNLGTIGVGTLSNLRGITLIDGIVHAANSAGTVAPNSVVKYDTSGNQVGVFSVAGLAPSPFYVYKFGNELLVSSSSGNNDIHRFDLSGNSLGAFYNGTLSFAEQMDTAADGNLLVGWFSSNRVSKHDAATGAELSFFAAPGARGVFQLQNGNVLWSSGAGASVWNAATNTSALVYAGGGRFFSLATVPGDDQTLSGTLSLSDTVGTFAVNRNIAWSVVQGTNTLASGTLTPGTPSSAMELSVPSSASGVVQLVLDGSSFLKRTTTLTLNGSTLPIGTVTMQNGDVDNSGEVDAADIDAVIADFGSTSVGATDVDVSGEVDAADIDIVIANFGGTDD